MYLPPVVGGRDSNSKMLDSVEVYDSSTDLWSTLSPIPTGRKCHSCTAIGSKILILWSMEKLEGSNHQEVDSVEVYDSVTGFVEYNTC